jgi:hypothetical protein
MCLVVCLSLLVNREMFSRHSFFSWSRSKSPASEWTSTGNKGSSFSRCDRCRDLYSILLLSSREVYGWTGNVNYQVAVSQVQTFIRVSEYWSPVISVRWRIGGTSSNILSDEYLFLWKSTSTCSQPEFPITFFKGASNWFWTAERRRSRHQNFLHSLLSLTGLQISGHPTKLVGTWYCWAHKVALTEIPKFGLGTRYRSLLGSHACLHGHTKASRGRLSTLSN